MRCVPPGPRRPFRAGPAPVRLLGALLLGVLVAGPAAARRDPAPPAPPEAGAAAAALPARPAPPAADAPLAAGSPASGSAGAGTGSGDPRTPGADATGTSGADATGTPGADATRTSAAGATRTSGAGAPGATGADAAPTEPSGPDPHEDRAGAIARDVALHPPQKPVAPHAAFRLDTRDFKLGSLLDRSVRGAENTEIGRVVDVLIGADGKPTALELDVGGFLGLGNRRIAVAWNLFDLSHPDGSAPLRIALSEAEVKSAPATDSPGKATVVMGAETVSPPAATVTPANGTAPSPPTGSAPPPANPPPANPPPATPPPSPVPAPAPPSAAPAASAPVPGPSSAPVPGPGAAAAPRSEP